ncbi:MAG: winged helix-turn-helix domain-containing protein [Jatrophihabitans sp.]
MKPTGPGAPQAIARNDRKQVVLTDARQMRAVAHPTRLALIGLLRRIGPLTATEAGEQLGESSGSMSFHLRQLAKYGLVEETGEGTGRRKPWRATAQFTTWSATPDDPELGAATTQFSRLLAARYAAAVQAWIDRQADETDDWRTAAQFGDTVLWLTADELAELGHKLTDLLRPYDDRLTDPDERPAGSRLVTWLHLSFPHEPS